MQLSPADGTTGAAPASLVLKWTSIPLAGGKYDFEVQEAGITKAGYGITYTGGPWLSTEASLGGKLEYGKTYRWRVRRRIAEPGSPWSGWWTFTTAAASPSIQLSPANGATALVRPVTLRWSADARTNQYDFRVFRGTTQVAGYGITYGGSAYSGTQAVLNDLEAGQTYTWEVRARVLDNGNPWAPRWTFSTLAEAPVPAPSNVNASRTAGSWTSVTLTWTSSAAAGSKFEIYQRQTGGPLVLGETAPAGATSAVRTGLAAGTSWTFYVKAIQPDGRGSTATASPEVSLTPQGFGPPTAPADGQTGVARANLLLDWTIVPEASTYDWEIYASNGTTLLQSGSGVVNSNTRLTGFTLTANRLHKWRVRARVLPNDNAWSPLWSFTTGP